MTGEAPLVSVLMTTYNAEAYVAESVESVLAQTYGSLELVAVDDASTDATAEIVEAYARRHPDRVRLLQASERRGPTRRRNDALAAARGPLLAWLDHDDLWLSTKVERQVAVLDQHADVGLVYSGYEAFDSETGATVEWRDESSEAEGDVLAALFVEGCFIASLTTLFRREALERRNVGFRERDFSFGDDYFLWLVIALDWKVVRVDAVLARYRRHAANESARIGAENYHLKRIEILDEFLARFPEARGRLGPSRRAGFRNHYLKAAGFELERGRRLAGARLLMRGLAYDPVGRLRVSDGRQA